MADLVTHGAAAVLLKAAYRGAMVPVFVLGTVAPDLFSRVPAILMGYVHVHLVSLPAWLTHGWQPLHQPVGLIILAYLMSMMFEAHVRQRVFANLTGGMALHYGIDLLQDHHGVGYLVGFPFWHGSFEFAMMGSEATVWWAVPLALAAGGLARLRLKPSNPPRD